MCCQSAYSRLRGYTKKLTYNVLFSAGSGRENKVFVLVFIKKDSVRIVSAIHNSIFDHTLELLLPEFRHDAGVDANTLPLVNETEILEALALELLVVVAFLAEKFVAMAESVVDEPSNMRAHLMHCVSLYCV